MNYETVLLKTGHLIMKKGEKQDFLKVYEYDFSKLKNVDGVFKFEKQDKSKLENLFKGGMKRYYSKIKKANMFDWIIYHDEVAVGNILTNDYSPCDKMIEVSFNVHPNYWKKGYATKALSCVIEYLYSVGYDNIICTYQDGNLSAKRVIDKLGFKPYKITPDSYKAHSGNLIDEYHMIMTKEDWFSKTGRIVKVKGSL